MNELDLILQKYEMDGWKENYLKEGQYWGTDKNTSHSYTDFYYNLLKSYKESRINILEIGNQYGASTLLWNKFLPKANIIGIDIYQQTHDKALENMDKNKVFLYQKDAYTQDSVNFCLDKFTDGYDIIIDDGPHSLDSQLYTIKNYVNLLKPNGYLIIEDVNNTYHLDVLYNNISDEFVTEKINLTSIKNRYDDLILKVQRKKS